MKRIFILIFFVGTTLKIFAQTDTNNVVLSDTFCFSNHKPIYYTAGTHILVKCDTVYILNSHTMSLYKAVASVLKRGTGLNTCNLMVDNMQARLDAQNKAFYQLYDNYIKLDSVSQKTITDTKSSLIQVNNTLVKAQTDIVVVDKKMDDIKKTINKQRVQSFFDKIIYGVGGVAVGVLVALIVSN